VTDGGLAVFVRGAVLEYRNLVWSMDDVETVVGDWESQGSNA